MKILIVEDEKEISWVWKEELKAKNYTIKVAQQKQWGGVTPVDALAINRFFVKLVKSFGDALKKTAADVNGDGNINPSDALTINRRFVKLIKSFPAGDWISDTNGITVYGSNLSTNIKIICTGDVNGSYIPK